MTPGFEPTNTTLVSGQSIYSLVDHEETVTTVVFYSALLIVYFFMSILSTLFEYINI